MDAGTGTDVFSDFVTNVVHSLREWILSGFRTKTEFLPTWSTRSASGFFLDCELGQNPLAERVDHVEWILSGLRTGTESTRGASGPR